MTKVIGVRFRTAGKVYFFDPLHFEIKRGDHVIVETARGIEYGTVVSGSHEVEDDKVIQPLKPVIRIANQRDMDQEAANRVKEREAYKICLEKIRKHELEMKLIDAEYTFDNNKVLFYFTADGRIDFRELVKDLAGVFKTRIELRQIGVRDETKIVGGIGICGRPLCCHTYLSDFIPVSVKMAKEQNLSLNPTKISGMCGRLMCCLKNEEETYEELNRRLPGIGDTVITEDGLQGEVQSVNVLRQLVKVVINVNDEKEIREYEADRLRFRRKHSKKERLELSKEELRELERLEQEDVPEAEQEMDSEGKPEKRREGSQERRPDRRGESGRERRQDRRGENSQERRRESRDESGQERRWEKRGENSQEHREEYGQERRQEKRGENSQEHHEECGQERRQEGRGESSQENREEYGQERHQERIAENGQDRRREGTQERRRDRRGNQDRRVDSRQNWQGGNRQDRQNENRQQDGGCRDRQDRQQGVQTAADHQQEQRREGRNNRYRRNRSRNDNRNASRNDNKNENRSEKNNEK